MNNISNAITRLQEARQYLIAILKDRGIKIPENATLDELQAIVKRLNNGEAVLLPSLENPAVESNIIAGYEAIDDKGEIIRGVHQLISGTIEPLDFMLIPSPSNPAIPGRSAVAIKTAPTGQSFSEVSVDLGSDIMPYNIVKGTTILGITGTATVKTDFDITPADSIVVGQAPCNFTIQYFGPGVLSYTAANLTKVDFAKGNPMARCTPQLKTPFIIAAPGGITIDPTKSTNIEFLYPLNFEQTSTVTAAVGVVIDTAAVLSIS